MFGLRKASKKPPASPDWPAIRTLLDDEGELAAVLHSFPVQKRESFLNAVRAVDPAIADDIVAAGNRLHSANGLIDCPVVAVAGMLNSGKTSLVSTFLSPSGRARTLRGVGNSQGTHRFVLWLPERWKADAALWSLLLARLAETLGRAPEPLGQTPDEAHRQYNNSSCDAESISVPLVATDPALDRVGIGLLDCPDIVSDESLGLGSPARRRELLGRAATLCSAFLVVASAEQCRDTTLAELMRIASELMPGVPRLLAVNKVRPREQTPAEVLATFSPLIGQYQIDSVYAAYDFDVNASKPYIPRELHNSVSTKIVASDELPIFFSLSDEPALNPPNPISVDRLLGSLPSKLDRGQLFERFRAALETNLRVAIWERGRGVILRSLESQQSDAKIARRCLFNVALDVFAIRGDSGEPDRLRLHQNKRIVEQLTTAFANTAP